MKICIDERAYQGSAAEIMEQLRQQTFEVGLIVAVIVVVDLY